MVSEGVMLDSMAYNTLLSGFFQVGKIGQAKKIFGEMRFNNVAPDVSTYNILIDGLCKNGCVTKAIEVFHTLKKKKSNFDLSIETYNCFLHGLCETGRLEIACNYFTNLPKKVCYRMLSHITSSSTGFVKKGSWKRQMICYQIWKKKVLLPT
ncbi:hypothetical protein Dsin_030144 [Dipteronia sinensis]|uniref:Pentatricopeptide repeat-containing protein n=1 Tax=Dipteronia sinensis TaxID=43782 RepID=A0AAD9ZID5_9ROSI|nr:hypothetical protein Dsin_030144 [Dipteronia sinensis]